jgi:sulfate permease, SulP family
VAKPEAPPRFKRVTWYPTLTRALSQSLLFRGSGWLSSMRAAAAPRLTSVRKGARSWSKHLRVASAKPALDLAALGADVLGGFVSSAVAIPLAVGYGMFAFVALGDEYFAYGAVAGLLSAVAGGLVCITLGDRTTRLYAPRITTTFFLGLLLSSLLQPDAITGASPAVSATLLKFFAIILLGGIFQALFGALRLGTLIKFAPHPVMAGFQNMAAILLFLVQLGNVLGFDRNVRFDHVIGEIGNARPVSVVVAVLTFLAMWHARRFTTRVPPLLVGLGVGVLAYYTLRLVGLGAWLGPVIGLPTATADVRLVLADLFVTGAAEPLQQAAASIVTGALALALIASIDALLCAKLASPPGDLRAGGDGLLVRIGIANAVSASAGGITTGINIGPSVVNRSFGGRSTLSVVVNSAVLFAAATVLFPIVAYTPRAVLSALIMVVAIQHIEPWTKQLAARLFQPGVPRRRDILLDLGVATLVSVLSIAVDVVLAVFIGILLSVFLFIVRVGRSNVRRQYRCDAVRSRRSRGLAEMEALRERGASVLVIELQGALFFGSAELLAQLIDSEARAGTTAVVMELRRVTEIDATGVRILADVNTALAGRGIKLGLVLSNGTETAVRIAEAFQAQYRVFPDIDRAIEWAEDDLLGQPRTDAAAASAELPLERVSILRDFTGDQIARLRAALQPVTWAAGEVIFRQGEPGSSLFIVTTGRASVHLADDRGGIRLASFTPGAVFGELAILDRGPRSATVIADEDVTGFGLSDAAFATLCKHDPDVAINLLSALGRELSLRLRYANVTIRQLEA